jgi:uncharacterized protein with von Willebrand factor type A (vWA) domain
VSAFLPNLLLFVRVLRRAGVAVHGGRVLDALQALDYVGIGRRGDVKTALRTVLVQRHEDLVTFDRAFDAFWRKRGEAWGRTDLRAIGERRSGIELRFVLPGSGGDEPESTAREDEPPTPATVQTWSAREALRRKNFAQYTADEVADARAALAALAWRIRERRTRRWVSGRGAALDLRRALRRTLRAGGELIVLPRRARATRPRPLVVLCDVSGSMERYTRMLLHFVHAIARDRQRVEAFLFATRLTRITRQVRTDRVDGAVSAVAHAVEDWAGGTRIGDALRELNMRWARRVLTRGPVVLVISDGWDRGDPDRLSAEMARLQRSCDRLIWLNPLLGEVDYQPLTRGIRAALPYIDDFLPAHNIASLERLAAHLSAIDRRPQGTRTSAGFGRSVS